ncbi:MAG TPA: hypothetical protein VFB34_10390 [Chloroflexota bacterium]|nr:hypothetical protein [Chloroflexota bacterium]
MNPVVRLLISCVSLIALLAGVAAIGSFVARPAEAAPIYQNGCITYDTTLPYAIKGSQFIVRSSTADASVAKTIAGEIDGKKAFQTYEKVLGLSSMLQPGENTQPVINGQHAFPIFVDDDFGSNASLFAPLCTHTTWGGLVVGSKIISPAQSTATIHYQLFRAAEQAYLQSIDEPAFNWWYSAMAVAAVAWLDPAYPAKYDKDLTNHPEVAMDDQESGSHILGAYRFVQWVLGTAGTPGKAGGLFLQNSLTKVKDDGPTDGVDAAIQSFTKQSLADEVGAFWADHTNPKPKFGPTGLMERNPIDQSEQVVTLEPAAKLAADLVDLRPPTTAQQVQIVVDNLPAGVDLYVNYGNGTADKIQAGQSADDLFCRSGYSPGSYPLPKTGDVRLAMTTVGDSASNVDVKVLTSTTPCPKKLLVVPGLEVGSLYLGMTMSNANKAAKLVSCQPPQQLPGNIVYQPCAYDETATVSVGAGFFNGQIGFLTAGGGDFITTNTPAVSMYYPDGLAPGSPDNTSDDYDNGCCSVPRYVAGSTEDDFLASATGATCQPYGTLEHPHHVCYYTGSKGLRYTIAFDEYQSCSDDATEDGQCFWPVTGYYVDLLVVATKQAAQFLLP